MQARETLITWKHQFTYATAGIITLGSMAGCCCKKNMLKKQVFIHSP